MTDQPSRAVAYCRQSEQKRGESPAQSLSLAGQAAAFPRWCEANNVTPIGTVQDHDLRGADPDRPGLAQLRDLVIAERPDTLWLLSLSRLARDVVIHFSTIRELQRLGVAHIYSEAKGWVADEFFHGIMALMHQRSRVEQSLHLRNAFALRARRGGFPPGPAPFGYKRPQTITAARSDGTTYQRQTGEPEIDAEQAEQIRAWASAILDGASLRSVVDAANASGPAPRGGRWTPKTVRDILTSPIVTGAVEHRGEVVARNDAWRILDDVTFARVGTLLQRAPVIRRDGLDSWLEGYVLHACGTRMYFQAYTGKSRGHGGSFVCGGQWDGTCGLGRRIVGARLLERATVAALLADLGARPLDPARAIETAQERAGGSTVARQRAALDKRAAAATARHSRMLDRFGNGKLSVERMDEEDERLAEMLATIERERATLPAPPDAGAIRAAASQLATVADLLAVMQPPELRALLAELGTVVVSDAGVCVRYRPPFDALLAGGVVPVPRWGRGFR